MLYPVPFRCPDGVWSPTFNGNVAMGVLNASGPESAALWLLFRVHGGNVAEIAARLGGSDIPEEITSADPVIVAVSSRPVWVAATENRGEFPQMISQGDMHLSGDYRVFGRYSPSLLRAIQTTDLWEHLDEIVAFVLQRAGG